MLIQNCLESYIFIRPTHPFIFYTHNYKCIIFHLFTGISGYM